MDWERLGRLQVGDEEAWGEAFDQLHPRLLSHFLAKRGFFDDGIEDLAQETLQKVAANIREFPLEDCERFEWWVLRIAENVFLDTARKAQRERRKFERFFGEVGDRQEPAPEVVNEMDDGDLRDDVRAALASLPERQRQAILLKHFRGWSTREVAREMRISEGTVSQHLTRGMPALRARLRRQNAARVDPCR